uniref:Uncharacterized protein n=1 Tax=Ursus americanus TaxID=9643 RepID=A0A452QNU8_URSAM
MAFSQIPRVSYNTPKYKKATYVSNQTEDWGRFMHTSDINHTKSNLSCHLLTCACRTVAHISNL